MNMVKTAAAEARPAAPPAMPKPAGNPVAIPASVAGPAAADSASSQPSKRDATFDRLSKMFRRTGTDVTAQALFRVLLEHRMEAGEEE
jgi:hypothetical protein